MLTKLALLWIAFALLLGFALGGSFVSAFLVPPSIEQGNANAEKTSAKSETPEERHQATEEALANYTKWLMFFTAVMAIATIVLGIATAGLYIAGERHSERQLRAYLWAHTHPVPNIGGSFNITSAIKNSGPTPAHKVQTWTMTDIFERPLPEGHAFAAAPAQFEGPSFVVNPESDHGMTTQRETPPSEKDIAAISAGTKDLYYWGEVRYRDAFRKNRYSRFRLRWLSQASSRGMWSYCEEGNEAN